MRKRLRPLSSPQTRPFLPLCFPPKGLRAAMFQRASSAAASRSERGSVLPLPHAEPLGNKILRQKCSIVCTHAKRPAERFTIYGSAFFGRVQNDLGIAFSRSIKCVCTSFTRVRAPPFSAIMCFTASPNAQIAARPRCRAQVFLLPAAEAVRQNAYTVFTYSAPTPFGGMHLCGPKH